ncbi:MAG: hypothetical protein AB7P52_10970 [Alphaproteobacteria bacterium]
MAGALAAVVMALGLCASLASPAAASNLGEGEPCARYAWPLERETDLLKEPAGAVQASPEARWESGIGSAFRLALEPGGTARFALPPEREAVNETWFGGAVTLPAPAEAGLYQVSVSKHAWIDVVQNGALVASEDFTGEKDCPVRKSVRFNLVAAPFVVQISDAAEAELSVVVTPAAE